MSYSNLEVRLKISLKRTRKRDRVFIRECELYVILIDNIIQLSKLNLNSLERFKEALIVKKLFFSKKIIISEKEIAISKIKKL